MKDHQRPDSSHQHKAISRREFLQMMGAVGMGSRDSEKEMSYERGV